MAEGEDDFHKGAEEAHTWRGSTNGKLDHQAQPHQPPTQLPACPECGSQRIWKDGVRCTNRGEVQRYICRVCGLRFSETTWNNSDESEDVERVHTTALYSVQALPYNCQVGVAETKGAKNLAEVESRIEKRAAGATKPSEAEVKGKIVEFMWKLKREGYSESTISSYGYIIKTLAEKGANITDLESVKDIIAVQDTWSTARKNIVVKAYSAFLKMQGLTWKKPNYRASTTLPFIPTEREIDDLIAGCGRQMATFLQLLKETAVRCGEALRLKWTDVDFVNNTLRITPEKGSEPRIFKISNKLATMLGSLLKQSSKVFSYKNTFYLRKTFLKQRRRIAHKLGNPRILQIHFHTFRHWKATMLYYHTKDILYVMRFLGHKNIKNTLIYVQLAEMISKNEDEYICKATKTLDEAKKLIETGFEFVTDMDGYKLFRRRK